jgi:hypothetical protein
MTLPIPRGVLAAFPMAASRVVVSSQTSDVCATA